MHYGNTIDTVRLSFVSGDVHTEKVYHAFPREFPLLTFPNERYNRGRRFGSEFLPIQGQSNKIRSETSLKIPFWKKLPEEGQIQSQPIWPKKNAAARRAAAFVHRFALIVWLAVLERMISAVLLHTIQNPLMSLFGLQNKRTACTSLFFKVHDFFSPCVYIHIYAKINVRPAFPLFLNGCFV